MSELVGEAYVRVHADTKYMKNALRRDLNKAGKAGAESLLASFDKTLQAKAGEMVSARHNALAEAIVGGDFETMFKKSGKTVEEFQKDTVRYLTKIKTATEANGGAFKEYQGSLDELEKWAQRSIAAREMKKQADTIDEAHRNALDLNKAFREQEKIAEALGKHFDDLDTAAMRYDIQRLTKDIREQVNVIDDAHAAALRRNKEFDAGKGKDFERSTERTAHWVSVLRKDLDKMSVSGGVGVIFGRGSRNNFLNFTGSVARNMTLIGETILKFPVIVADATINMVSQFKALQASGQSITQILGSGLAGGAAAAGPALAAVGAAAAGLVVVLPILISLVSALAAGIIAMAAAISFAIAGALLPLVPAIVAVAAVLGPAIIAFKELKDNMTDAQKSAMVPLTKAWKDLRVAMRPVINDLTKEFANWGSVIKAVTPFVTEMGDVAVMALGNLRQQLSAPEMDKFLKVWGTRLPLIFDSLARAVNGLLVGLIEFFTPVIPYAERLANAIEDGANRFADWAGSAAGQNAIKDFMDKAFTAAHQLWDSIVNIGIALGNIFGVAQEGAGGSFLTWLEDITSKWATWTGDVENQKSLKAWFEEAVGVGRDLVDLLGSVFDTLSSMDTEESRKNLQGVLDLLVQISTAMGYVGSALQQMSSFGEQSNAFLDGVAAAMSSFGAGVNSVLTSVYTSMATFGANVNSILTSILGGFISFSQWVMSGFGLEGALARIGEWLVAPFRWAWDQLFGHSYIPDIVNGLIRWLGMIPGIVTGALATVGSLIITPFRTAYSALTKVLSQIPGVVSSFLHSAVARIPAVLASVATIVSTPFRTGATAIFGVLRAAAGTIASVVASWVGRARAAVAGVTTALTAPFSAALRTISGIMSSISGFISRIPGLRATAEAGKQALRTIMNAAIDRYNSLPLPDLPRMATGGITTGRTIAGESGQEMVIPLNRSIGTIDPSVREIAALIRGQGTSQAAAGRSLSIAPGAIVVSAPNSNPLLVAESLMDRLVAAAT
jgi:hypothetical protein